MDSRLCENPKCREPFEPHVHNQRICERPACRAWKARENRKAYKKRKVIERAPGVVDMPTWAEGCLVGSMLWCPFPGVTCW